MDSVTQFALGACVGVAVLGRKLGPRRAALAGGLLGTLPDLDVFLTSDDPIESFVQHRGWTHSLFVHAALTPVFGEATRLLFSSLRENRGLAYAAVFLCLSSHAILDAITVYGTRLFWPLSVEPVALGSIFIIDPLYTLPLLVAMIWAMFLKSLAPSYRKILTACLCLSTAYLGWTVLAQQWMTNRAKEMLATAQITPDQMIAIPTPFNSVIWRIIGIQDDRYFNLYLPVFGGTELATFYIHDRHLALKSCAAGKDRIDKIASFSDGYYRMVVQDGNVIIADLRMGLTPDYAFRFVIGQLKQGKFLPVSTRRLEGRGNIGQDLAWLRATLGGETTTRPAEAAARTNLSRYASASSKGDRIGQC